MSNVHLNSDQISAWLAGEQPVDAANHLALCSECQRQVAQFESVIATFRGSVRATAEISRVPAFRAPERTWSPSFTWAVAGALAAVLAVTPLYLAHDRHQKTPVSAPLAEVSDAALFEQVNAQLSRSVPRAMQPLAELAWTANDLEVSGSSTKGSNQ